MEQLPVNLILHDIRSHHNVGSIFRSADAFAVQKLILCGITPRPPHRDIHKTALGATDSVAWEYEANILEALGKLEGPTIALEQDESSRTFPKQPWGDRQILNLIVGNEVKGVSHEVLDVCDEIWEIPQYGVKKSLNVSVSAGIILHYLRIHL